VDNTGWDLDITGPRDAPVLSKKIVDAVDSKLDEISTGIARSSWSYTGDCARPARSNRLERHGSVGVRGPHCYEMFAGTTSIDHRRSAGHLLLDDWLVRNFERAVVRGLGLDRYPELKRSIQELHGSSVTRAVSPTLVGREAQESASISAAARDKTRGLRRAGDPAHGAGRAAA